MYIRTPHAMVWVEAPMEQANPTPKTATTGHTPYQERWAKKPLNTAKGRCVAVRQSRGNLELGYIRNNHLSEAHILSLTRNTNKTGRTDDGSHRTAMA